MKIITDNPKSNIGNMHNMAFVKDNQVYLRGLGKNNEDISLVKSKRV